MSHSLVAEIPSIWFDKWRYDDAEKAYQEANSSTVDPYRSGDTGDPLSSEKEWARKELMIYKKMCPLIGIIMNFMILFFFQASYPDYYKCYDMFFF